MATCDAKNTVLTVGPLDVFPDQELARIDGRAVVVSGHAFGLLVALAKRPRQIVTRDTLYSEVWGGRLQPTDRSVDVIMVKLRGALARASQSWQLIHTHPQRGYRLAPVLCASRARSLPGGEIAPERTDDRIVVRPVEIVPADLLVIVDGREVQVRPRDMDVLLLLAGNAGRVLTRASIFEEIWKAPLDPRDRSVDVSVGHLRSALSKVAPRWDFFHTHFRRGYRFEPVVRSKRRATPRRSRTGATGPSSAAESS